MGVNDGSTDGYIYGQTGYLGGKPKLVRLMKTEECDKRLYSDLIHNYAMALTKMAHQMQTS